MVTIACPWCEDDVPLSLGDLAHAPALIWPCCATAVELVGDVDEPTELAGLTPAA
jgi:hypothetical protein